MLHATVVHLEECPDTGPACESATPPAPYVHHVELDVEETDLDATWGLARWLALELRFPLRYIHETPSYFAQDGTTPRYDVDDTHHRNETLFGPGDPWIVARAGASSGRLVTAARVGVSVPLGSTVPDPYELGRRGVAHEHFQLGSGTFVPIVGGALAYDASPVDLSLVAMAFFSFYEDSFGYRAPSRGFASGRATWPLLDGSLRPYVASDLVREGLEMWHGEPGAESYARTDWLLGGGLGWRFAAPWYAEAGARLPVVRDTQGASYEYRGLLQLALGTSLDLVAP